MVSLQRRIPGIHALVKKYNALRDCLLESLGQSPHRHSVPNPLIEANLFNPDGNTDIWQDIGLDPNADDADEPPLWMGDERMKAAILAVLAVDRASEELKRLSLEVAALAEWITEQLRAYSHSIKNCTGVLIGFTGCICHTCTDNITDGPLGFLMNEQWARLAQIGSSLLPMAKQDQPNTLSRPYENLLQQLPTPNSQIIEVEDDKLADLEEVEEIENLLLAENSEMDDYVVEELLRLDEHLAVREDELW
jgi:hypothetical protein